MAAHAAGLQHNDATLFLSFAYQHNFGYVCNGTKQGVPRYGAEITP